MVDNGKSYEFVILSLMWEYIICPRLQAFLVGNHITNDGVMVSILASTCLPADCCFDELHLLKNPTRCVGLVQSGHHNESSRPNVTCSRHDIAEKLLIWCWTIFVHFFVGEGCRCLTSLCIRTCIYKITVISWQSNLLIEECEKPWKKPPQTFHKSLRVLCYVVSCIRFLLLLAYTGPSWQHYRPPGKAVHWDPYLNLYNHSQE